FQCYSMPNTAFMKRWQLIAFSAFTALLAGGCHLPSASGAKRLPLPPALAAEFSYSRVKDLTCKEKELPGRREYSIKAVELPCPTNSTATRRSLVLDYFLPRKTGKLPVLVILPMLGGSYPLEKYF